VGRAAILQAVLTAAWLGLFLAEIFGVRDLGPHVSWATLASAFAMGVSAGRWRAVALAFTPLPLILAGVGGVDDEMAFGVFLALGVIAFAPAITAGVALRKLVRRVRRQNGLVAGAAVGRPR
jgi:hypothetical protein